VDGVGFYWRDGDCGDANVEECEEGEDLEETVHGWVLWTMIPNSYFQLTHLG